MILPPLMRLQTTSARRVWEIRNKVVHPAGKRAEREEVEVMIDRITGICLPWEKDGLSRKRIAASAVDE